jgi:hypothetical protein
MNKTLPNPYYLFSFQHIASKERVSFIPQVITTNTRYDKFRFVESTVTNLSVIPPVANFNYNGQYYYSIYEQVSPTNTNIDLTYNKLESGRAIVINGNDQTDECFFEPYISQNEDDASVIFVSEQEEYCSSGQTLPTPTPTVTTTATPTVTPTNTTTPTNTATPTTTPTPSATGGLPPGILQFLVSSGDSQGLACALTPSSYVYAQDLGNCGGCAPLTCWACLTTSQQVFKDVLLTQPVDFGWYKNDMNGMGANATWFIVGGFPQSGGFMSC